MKIKVGILELFYGKRSYQENLALHDKGYASKNSLHLTGKAVDIIDTSVLYSNNHNHPYYQDLASAAKRYNVKWGGNFLARWDPCHIEMQ